MKLNLLIVSLTVATVAAGVQREEWFYNHSGREDPRFCKFVPENLVECPHSDISFFLYTRNTPSDQGEQVLVSKKHPNGSNLLETRFDPSHPTKILIHGYNSDMFLSVLTEVKKEYFIRGDYNVFDVDWSRLAKGPCYPAAVYNIRVVGKCLAKLIQKIQETTIREVHLIGFSLGAHVAGISGFRTERRKVSRITGLDPAMPGFVTIASEFKLSPDDALFVDVLHTNAFVQGIVESCGHVDFYVNGGSIQPGCWAEPRFLACNHHRSAIYFAESINTKVGFMGWPCYSYSEFLLGLCPPQDEGQIIMGEFTDPGESRGNYLVITNSVAPFAVGKYIGPTIEIVI